MDTPQRKTTLRTNFRSGLIYELESRGVRAMDSTGVLQDFHIEEQIACSINGDQYMLVIQGEQHSGENVM
jgi:hypothetical protein